MAEPDLSKDVRGFSFDGNILIDHRDLLSIEGQLSLVDSDTDPEVMYLLVDGRADLSDAVHFFKRCERATMGLTHHIELFDRLGIRLVVWIMHSFPNITKTGLCCARTQLWVNQVFNAVTNHR